MSEQDAKLLDKMNVSFCRTTHCGYCGRTCYARKNKNKVYCPGFGLCKPCGGTETLQKPRDVMVLSELQVHTLETTPKVWSCPVHGLPTPF